MIIYLREQYKKLKRQTKGYEQLMNNMLNELKSSKFVDVMVKMRNLLFIKKLQRFIKNEMLNADFSHCC